jgi:tetratricopeptide (TPR) repeat protein
MAGGKRVDFFLSRRGSVAALAQEVAEVLIGQGYSVTVQDYDIPFTANFVEAMHEAIKSARDLIVLFSADYEASPHTRKEFTSFEADRAHGGEERRIVILRCDDVPLRGLFASNVFQDLFGIDDPQERRQRILAAAEGRSQAQKPPPRPFVGVLPRLPHFTGRDAELDRLDAILLAGIPAPGAGRTAQLGRAAVQGIGGVGKTSLAVEYACRYRDLYAGVWWCPAETRVGLLTSLAALAVELGAVADDEADIEKAAKAALRRLGEQRATFLLVYDNVPSPDDIADLLPAAGACVLITSRFADWSGWAEDVAVDVMPLTEATAFLQTRAGREDPAGARVLAEALGRLPLALDHAAAYCKRTQTRFADYAAKAARLIAAVPRGSSYPRSVAATFDLAITQAVAQCPAAETLMAYLAECAPERLPIPLIEGAIDDELERDEALLALTEVSLLKHDPFEDGTPAVTVHRLVLAVARARAAASGRTAPAAAQVAQRLTAIYPDDGNSNPASWPLCGQLTPHLLALYERDAPGSAPTAEDAALLGRAAAYFYGRAAYARAAPLAERALAISEATLGGEHPSTVTSLSNLALVLQAQGNFSRARPLFERALAVNEATLGPAHPTTATSLDTLASLLQATGDLPGARPLFERALAINEAALGPARRETATSLNNLALVLQAQGDLAGAQPLFERALAINRALLGEAHPATATSLDNLAGLLKARGNLAAARPLYERALTVRETTLGAEHPNTATSLNNLASLLRMQGDVAAARELFERALAIYETSLGPEHPSTAATLNNLALLLRSQNDLAAARPLYERALAINEKALGPEHPDVMHSVGNLAFLLQAQGDMAGARARFERALAIAETALGAEHPSTASSLNNLALLLQAQGDIAAARPLLERALAIREKLLGPEHADTATSLNNLALLLQAQGDLASARPLLQRALAIYTATLGAEHPSTARVRSHFARLLLACGDPAAALAAGEAALATHQRTLGPEHRWTLDSARVTADAHAALMTKPAAARERHGLAEAS